MAESKHYRTATEQHAFRERVAAMRNDGLTYREIGRRLDLTPERARQIVKVWRAVNDESPDR